MNEITFLKGLAAAARQSYNPEVVQLVAWCEKIAKATKTCGGNEEMQPHQAGADASMLMAHIRHMEEEERKTGVIDIPTVLNAMDAELPLYTLTADYEKRVVIITVTTPNKVDFEPFTVSMYAPAPAA